MDLLEIQKQLQKQLSRALLRLHGLQSMLCRKIRTLMTLMALLHLQDPFVGVEPSSDSDTESDGPVAPLSKRQRFLMGDFDFD